MTYAELQQKAHNYCEAFPEQDREQVFINGFIQGMSFQKKEDVKDEA